jgi:hypothetical protein
MAVVRAKQVQVMICEIVTAMNVELTVFFGCDDIKANNIFTDISVELVPLSTQKMEAADSSETLVLLHYTVLHLKRQ